MCNSALVSMESQSPFGCQGDFEFVVNEWEEKDHPGMSQSPFGCQGDFESPGARSASTRSSASLNRLSAVKVTLRYTPPPRALPPAHPRLNRLSAVKVTLRKRRWWHDEEGTWSQSPFGCQGDFEPPLRRRKMPRRSSAVSIAFRLSR